MINVDVEKGVLQFRGATPVLFGEFGIMLEHLMEQGVLDVEGVALAAAIAQHNIEERKGE